MNPAVFSIAKRELRSFFFSPIAYIVMGVFSMVVGWFFFKDYFLWQRVSMGNFFRLMPLALSFTIPALTMKAFSEEFRSGSFEILKTLPVSIKEIVVGKFLGNWCFAACLFIPTVIYAISVATTGSLDWGPVLGSYIGTLLLAAFFCGIGLFASALTKNQVVAYIIGIGICFPLAFLNQVLVFFPAFIQKILGYLSVGVHFDAISDGVLSLHDLYYFVLMTFIALSATYIVIQEKN